MKELIKKQVGSIIRTLLAPLATWLLAQGLSTDQAEQFLAVLGTLILGAAWGVWEKYDSKKKTEAKVETALSLPEGSTKADLARAMAGDVSG